jgi:TRAP-type uncharacterized transport system fused permease subunit
LGSTIANVATTSPFIKHTDFTPERAGAVDVISSTNAQLTPPVTGAAAFLICECTGVSYPDLIKHAFLPAVISNIALLDSVHLQALKLGLKDLPRTPVANTILQKRTSFFERLSGNNEVCDGALFRAWQDQNSFCKPDKHGEAAFGGCG